MYQASGVPSASEALVRLPALLDRSVSVFPVQSIREPGVLVFGFYRASGPAATIGCCGDRPSDLQQEHDTKSTFSPGDIVQLRMTVIHDVEEGNILRIRIDDFPPESPVRLKRQEDSPAMRCSLLAGEEGSLGVRTGSWRRRQRCRRQDRGQRPWQSRLQAIARYRRVTRAGRAGMLLHASRLQQHEGLAN